MKDEYCERLILSLLAKDESALVGRIRKGREKI